MGRPSASPSFSPRARKDAKHAGAGEKPPRPIAMNAPMKSRYPESLPPLDGRSGRLLGRGRAARSTGSSPADKVFDPDAGVYGRWFVGARVQHLPTTPSTATSTRGRGEQAAIIYDSPVTGTKRAHHLRASCSTRSATLGAVLQDLGVGKGDRVIIYMPMIPEAVDRACWPAPASARSIRWCSAASPPTELATRIDDAEPKVDPLRLLRHRAGRVVAYKPLLDEAIALAAHKPRALPRSCSGRRPRPRLIAGPRPRLGRGASPRRRPTAARPTACRSPPPIRSTSSTPRARPASPKGVVRDNGGHMVALEMDDDEPSTASSPARSSGPPPTSAGWSAIPTSSTRRCCTAAPRSSTRASRSARRTPAPSGASSPSTASSALFTAPTAFRAIKKEDPRRRAASSATTSPRFRTLFLAGERADPDTVQWAEAHARGAGDRPLVADRDRLADRRQSGRARACCRSSTARRRVPMPGYDVRVLDEGGKPVPRRTRMGTIVVKLPLPPGCLPTLWNADERFRDSYLATFPGYYKTADAGFIDEDGYVFVMGAHRRHHQRRRPPPLDRRHGGGAGLASRRRRMRRDRRRGRAQGPGAAAASWC